MEKKKIKKKRRRRKRQKLNRKQNETEATKPYIEKKKHQNKYRELMAGSGGEGETKKIVDDYGTYESTRTRLYIYI